MATARVVMDETDAELAYARERNRAGVFSPAIVTLLSVANGIYRRDAAPAAWDQAAYDAQVRADQAARDTVPRPEGACDVSTCRAVATLVWHRTDAELAAGRSKRGTVRMLPTLRVCAVHAAPWRTWARIGEERPAPALAIVRPKAKRRHCKSCTCGRD